MKRFKVFLEDRNDSTLNGQTHSIIDGLNRSKNSIMNNNPNIHAKIIDQKNLKPLSPEEADEHDKAAAEAKKNGDYFTGSTFGNSKQRYSVQQALDHARSVPTKKIPTKGFVSQQVSDHWQVDIDRAKKAIPSKDQPILIMKHYSDS
jgi:hypothetical protein